VTNTRNSQYEPTFVAEVAHVAGDTEGAVPVILLTHTKTAVRAQLHATQAVPTVIASCDKRHYNSVTQLIQMMFFSQKNNNNVTPKMFEWFVFIKYSISMLLFE